MNIKVNLKDLIKDAYCEQYAGISDTEEQIKHNKPRCFFSITQLAFIAMSIMSFFIMPRGFSTDFAGYAISGLSLFVGLFFTFVLTLLDKINAIDFSKYRKSINKDNHPIGVRLKNYFRKVTILSHYAILISIICILLLSITLIFEDITTVEIKIPDFIFNLENISILSALKTIILLLYRGTVIYFLLDFILITIYLVTSSYDYIVSELNKINLS